MYKLTTPTFTLTFPEGTDLGLASNVYATFAKDGKEIATKKDSELVVNGNVVEVFFSQEETAQFPTGLIDVQVNWTYQDGGQTKRACSTISKVNVHANLYKKVI